MQDPHVCLSSLNPPPPNDDEGIGRRFMALVRSAEKQPSDNDALSNMLQELISLYSRQGLLQNNVERARSVLESSASSSTSTRAGGKRHSTSESNQTASDDESLVLSGLIRILTPKESSSDMNVALAGDVCTAIFTRIQDMCSQTVCARAEEEIVFKSSRSLLTGLGATLMGISTLLNRNRQQSLALTCCLQATTCLISILGAKVHRPSISTIRQAAWTVVADSAANVRQSSALLLSVLPLTGVGNAPPADAWSSSVSDAVVSLVMLLNAMAPLRPLKLNLTMVSEETQSTIVNWINHARVLGSEAERVAQFQLYIQGVTLYLVALLTRQAYPDSTGALMMTAKLPIESLLDVSQAMIQFPSVAETTFFSTKKRLSMEVVQGGLLSPAAAVLEMANLIKKLGHDVLDSTLSTAGSSLLPFARTVMRLVESSLLSSTSTSLQRALDPTKRALVGNGNRQQWLQNSVLLRTRAVQTYGLALQTLGASVLAGPLSNDRVARNERTTRNEMQSVSSIGGSLLEQLTWSEESRDNWATFPERTELCAAGLNSLSTVLTTGGGYLPLSCRTLIDSIASTCLTSIGGTAKNRIVTWPSVTVSILKLGTACLTTPWPDGAMSSLSTEVKRAAMSCTNDCDDNVAAEADSCLRLCNALSTPRVPSLSIVTSREQGRNLQTAFSLAESLKTAREESSTTERLASKPSRPLEPSPKKEQKDAKRQKVESEPVATTKAAMDPVKSVTPPSPRKSDLKAVPAPATNGDAKLPAESESKKSTEVEENSRTATQSFARKPDAKTAGERQGTKVEEALSSKHTAPVSLKKDPDDESDDDFFPEIVIDGGPDDEDQ